MAIRHLPRTAEQPLCKAAIASHLLSRKRERFAMLREQPLLIRRFVLEGDCSGTMEPQKFLHQYQICRSKVREESSDPFLFLFVFILFISVRDLRSEMLHAIRVPQPTSN